MVMNNMSHVLDIKPRVIAAEVKTPIRRSPPIPQQSKPRIAGELDLVGETTSEPHYVEVRDGALLVYPGRSREPHGSAVWRLPLRYLNLQPASSGRPRGFSLSRHGDSIPLATFQVGCEPEYEKWVKTLAAELIRQTPLDAVRFLDILGITATLSRPCDSPIPLRRVYSADSVRQETTTPRSRIASTTCSAIQEEEMSSAVASTAAVRGTRSLQRPRKSTKGTTTSVPHRVNLSIENRENLESATRIRSRLIDCSKDKPEYVKHMENASLPDVIRDLPPCERRSRARSRVDKPRRVRNLSAEPLVSSLSDETVTKLMALCQQDDHYVPVRDKRLLFETLCRRRFVCSTDNISLPCTDPASLAGQPRAQSLHDLSDCNSVVVKDIRKYFERGGPPVSSSTGKKRTLSEQRQSHRTAHNRHNIMCLRLTGEALWRLQQQSNKIRL